MKKRNPRHGSMQFWPRVRSKRTSARIRSFTNDIKNGAIGFAGYKVGMTHLMIVDNRGTSKTKGTEIFCPATIIECPPLKVLSVRFYKKNILGFQAVSQILAENLKGDIAKAIKLPKKATSNKVDANGFDDVTLVVHTQPKLTTIGKKKPEIFEIAIGGSKEEKIKYAQEKLGKEIMLNEIFQEGEQIDTHTITKGKGFSGAVKRFGINLRHHKSEKSIRNPGSLGGWKSQGHVMYRIAHAGQHGYHQRTEYNKQIIKIGDDPKIIMQKGGFVGYGVVKNPYLIVKGSVSGVRKRLIKFTHAIRKNKLIPKEAPTIKYLSQESKQ